MLRGSRVSASTDPGREEVHERRTQLAARCGQLRRPVRNAKSTHAPMPRLRGHPDGNVNLVRAMREQVERG